MRFFPLLYISSIILSTAGGQHIRSGGQKKLVLEISKEDAMKNIHVLKQDESARKASTEKVKNKIQEKEEEIQRALNTVGIKELDNEAVDKKPDNEVVGEKRRRGLKSKGTKAPKSPKSSRRRKLKPSSDFVGNDKKPDNEVAGEKRRRGLKSKGTKAPKSPKSSRR